jgi:hypothetical protein
MFSLRNNVRRTDSPLVYIIKRFPKFWGQISRLADDEKFADLCRDYVDAVELYRYWRERSEPRALERAQDYITIAAELEAEILREITASGHLTTER